MRCGGCYRSPFFFFRRPSPRVPAMSRSEKTPDAGGSAASSPASRTRELLAPISIARGHARLLLDGRRGPLSEEQRQSIETIARQADKLEQLLSLMERDLDGAPARNG